jgi:diacylglycerol kinase
MPRSWPDRFRDAFRGLFFALGTERSFRVHLPAAVLVGVAAAVLRVSAVEACVLGLCVTLVLAIELANTAIEHLARAVTSEQNPIIRNALDISSAAVLMASLGAATIGLAIFLPKLLLLVR